MERENQIVTILGNSGSGKSTLEKMVRDRLAYLNPISATTRKQRVGEINGKDYYYYDEIDFLKKVEENEFVEYVNYAGNYYGSLKKELENKLKDGNIVCVLEPNGAKALYNLYKDRVKLFYIKVDAETLKERFFSRESSLEGYSERLELDNEFEKQLKDLPYELIYNNGNIEDAFLEIKKKLEENTTSNRFYQQTKKIYEFEPNVEYRCIQDNRSYAFFTNVLKDEVVLSKINSIGLWDFCCTSYSDLINLDFVIDEDYLVKLENETKKDITLEECTKEDALLKKLIQLSVFAELTNFIEHDIKSMIKEKNHDEADVFLNGLKAENVTMSTAFKYLKNILL